MSNARNLLSQSNSATASDRQSLWHSGYNRLHILAQLHHSPALESLAPRLPTRCDSLADCSWATGRCRITTCRKDWHGPVWPPGPVA